MRVSTPLRLAAAGALVPALLLSGCATIIRGGDQDVTVRCSDPKAILRAFDGESTKLIQPGKNTFKRNRSYILTAEGDGGKTRAQGELRRSFSVGYLLADIFLTGLTGIIIDAVTGAWNTLHPDEVTLEPKPAG